MTADSRSTDRTVDALLAAHPVPTLDGDFASRVLAAAASPMVTPARTVRPRRIGRPWRRSPLWLGFLALNIVAASAVAAMVSGFPVWHHVTAIVQKVSHSLHTEPAHPARHRAALHSRVVDQEGGRHQTAAILPVAIADKPELSVATPLRPLKVEERTFAPSFHSRRRMPIVFRQDQAQLTYPRTHSRLEPRQPRVPEALHPHRRRDKAERHEGHRFNLSPSNKVEVSPVVMPSEPTPYRVRPAHPYGPRYETPRAMPGGDARYEQRREERSERRRMRGLGPSWERPHMRRLRGRFRR